MTIKKLTPTQWVRNSGSDTIKARYAFRVLRPDELPKIKKGIFCADSTSAFTAEDHVRSGKRKTAWISFTDSFKVAFGWAKKDGCAIAVIDISKVGSECADFRNGFSGKKGVASCWAIASREICFKGNISADAITRVILPEELDFLSHENQQYKVLIENSRNPYEELLYYTFRKVSELSQDEDIWEKNLLPLIAEFQKLWSARNYVWSESFES